MDGQATGADVMSMRIAVSACPYSGTHYIHQVFTQIGLRVGHEREFGVDGIIGWRHALWRRKDFYRLKEVIPYDKQVQKELFATIGKGFARNLRILHQVRHPLMVISALRKMPAIDWKRTASYIDAAQLQWDPLSEENPLRRACKFWLIWNTCAERTADLTYRVENIKVCWPYILRLFRLPFVKLPDISKTTGRHRWTQRICSWYHISENAPDIVDDILTMTERYGYTKEPVNYLTDDRYQFT